MTGALTDAWLRRRLVVVGGVLLWLATSALLAAGLWPAAAQPLVPSDGVGTPEPGTTAQGGQALYRQQCAWCHGTDGDGSARGPSLVTAGAASVDYYLRSGRMPLPHPDADSRRGRPSYDEEQREALVDYVSGELGDQSGPPVPEVPAELVRTGQIDLSAGGVEYRLNCASCHNWDGKGGAMTDGVNAPVLHGLDPLLVAEAVRVGPGAMPAFGEDVLDDQALADVAGYVEYLSSPRDAGGWDLAHWGPSTEMLAGFAGLGVILLATARLGGRA